MSDYTIVKSSKLKLKGEKKAHRRKKIKVDEQSNAESEEWLKQKQEEEDTSSHGGWWYSKKFEEILGTIALEFGSHTYVKSLDNGLFVLGAPHDEGDPPNPEEIFTAIRINEDKIALKSGYGKYLKIDTDGEIIGRSDAVGAPEQWEPIFENEEMALMGHNGCFMSINPEDDSLIAKAKKAGPDCVVRLRCQAERASKKDEIPVEEKGNIKQIEINYVKKFQKFQDKRMRLCTEDNTEVKKAHADGVLHEALLDRRSKMKADRYCK